ncbi:aromatic ring-hydroxylating oxygenase subunit alpha [Derxia gummosa]|uniref:Aromatic ring-hydroxylating oxygenase subunit alpha n=1 Tax=Derxia gummosa DSM 723 TaxID=1121388 RepID=A0A8B6X7R5_9BURK|nr:aromatic ring-hydroxylating dioxygenase subunit alpha [Derxia gummosa]
MSSTTALTFQPTPGKIRELIANRRPGYCLDAPFYTDEAIYKLDIEAIFGKHWIYVGVEPEVAEAGDFLTVEIGGESVLVVRHDDGSLRAFHNVCRHRGARLCEEKHGSVGNLVCPYHAWTYNLDGELVHAGHMGSGFDASKHGLKPVHVKSIEGLIFVCMAKDAPADFDELAKIMSPYIAPHRLKDCKIAASVDIVEQGNWKLVVENNRECYHCVPNHPELTISLFEFGFGYAPGSNNTEAIEEFKRIVETSACRWEGMGLPSREIDHLDDRTTGFRTQRLPLTQAGESQTMSTEVACKKLLGDLTERALGGLSFWTQPNSWHHFMSDHIVTFSILPVSAGKTIVRTQWLVHKDAVEGVDYDVNTLTEVWRATNDQDRKLVEMTQRGATSSGYEPGPYSEYTEGLVEKFMRWYIGRLNAVIG